MSVDKDSNGAADRQPRARGRRAAWLALGLLAVGVVSVLALRPAKVVPLRQAQWQQIEADGFRISTGADQIFDFDGSGNRVLVADASVFHFSTNQDFSAQAWIRAYPVYSRLARWLNGWLGTYPQIAQFTPKPLAAWLSARSRDNDFGVTPVIDKHQTPSTIESVGFQLYLDSGRLACQLSSAPMRQLAFQNFVSPGPNLQDGRWHHVALTVVRDAPAGGKLFVDGRQVYTFDPTNQNGDLSNDQPLRIGNHSNPGLLCRYKGRIAKVTLYRRALSADEIATGFHSGHP